MALFCDVRPELLLEKRLCRTHVSLSMAAVENSCFPLSFGAKFLVGLLSYERDGGVLHPVSCSFQF